MYEGRWRHIADVYAELGLPVSQFPVSAVLYEPTPQAHQPWFYPALAAALLGVAVGAAIAAHFLRTHRRQTSLARVQMLYAALEQSPASIVVTRPDAVISYVNPHFTAETGFTSEEVVGQTPAILESGLTARSVYDEMWGTLRAGKAWHGEFIYRRKSGEVFWADARIAPVKGSDGSTAHYVGVLLDVTERTEARERLAHLAHHDVLTGLPNRILFYERLNQSVALAKRNATRVALMMIDIDWFKEINDNYGHDVGDVVLQEVAKRMTACIREADAIGRIGGDEFVVLLNDIGNDRNAMAIAREIRAKMADPVVALGRTLEVTLSIGVALFPDHGIDVAELQRRADAAMYESKTRGRDRISLSREDLPGPIV